MDKLYIFKEREHFSLYICKRSILTFGWRKRKMKKKKRKKKNCNLKLELFKTEITKHDTWFERRKNIVHHSIDECDNRQVCPPPHPFPKFTHQYIYIHILFYAHGKPTGNNSAKSASPQNLLIYIYIYFIFQSFIRFVIWPLIFTNLQCNTSINNFRPI